MAKPNRGPGRPGRPRRFDHDAERSRLMDAAVQVMSRNGYAAMTVSDVLAEADLSTTAFYRHFDSKDALVEALVRHDVDAVERSLRRAMAAAPGPVAAVGAWVDGMLDVHYEPRKAARTALFTRPDVTQAWRMGERIGEVRSLLAAPLAEVLAAGHAAGVLRSPDPENDAASVFALVGAAAMSPRGRRDRRAARAQVVRFVWPALGLPVDDPTVASGV